VLITNTRYDGVNNSSPLLGNSEVDLGFSHERPEVVGYMYNTQYDIGNDYI